MRKFLSVPLFLLVAWLITANFAAIAQNNDIQAQRKLPEAALQHLKKNKAKLDLADDDIADLAVTDEYVSKHNGIKHVYVVQRYNGIEIHGTVTNINISKEGRVLNMGDRLQKAVSKRVKTQEAKLSSSDAVMASARHINKPMRSSLNVKEAPKGKNKATTFDKAGISLEPITAKLIYQPMEDGSLRLAWEVMIYELDGENCWLIRTDANTGEELGRDNLVAHCTFDNDGPLGQYLHSNHGHIAVTEKVEETNIPFAAPQSTTESNVYNVYAMPVESPIHGDRSMVSGSDADKIASPLGWHSTGAVNYTITKGNNVYAYDDPDNTGYVGQAADEFGYSPDGGSNLVFNYPVDFSKEPVAYKDAAITNLFYWNNIIHDMWYQYGFDEVSGNFQTNNFGRGGLGGDHVMAEAQDSRNISSTRNNANFGTLPEGLRPRMQMYLWSGLPDQEMFKVTSPTAIAGVYPSKEAAFSAKLTPTPVTGKLVLVEDGKTNPEGCEVAITNADEIEGNIAVMYRGTCGFADKVRHAQLAGAIGVIVINNAPGDPIVMGGTPTVPTTYTIPALMISQASGATIRQQLDNNTDVTVAMKNDGSGPEVDGDFDNGIIVHEYGHGISNRLTGGPSVTNCLGNAEQAGEGWSDWFGLMMTMKPGDKSVTGRGIGTYASLQPTSGPGIRPFRYSTDFSVNPATYGITNNSAISQPHGIGFVFATMLWDMNWALIDKYGYDNDLYYGKGGNNMAMQLVIDGLKLQVCRPGFVDSRDAILLADRINYGGANQELLWNVFAKRGLGVNASQGSSANRFDQVEDFNVPTTFLCSTPLTVSAVPTSNVYTGGVATNLYIGYGPQSVKLVASGDASNTYQWSPATGLSNDTIADPIFTPTAPGTYTFTVTAVNDDQCTKSKSITITVIDIRCGKKNEKVMVCINGDNVCVPPVAARAMLQDGGKLGSCAPGNSNLVTSAITDEASKVVTSISSFPNPFSESATFNFSMEKTGMTTLKVYDVTGREVATLFDGNAEAGVVYTTEFKAAGLKGGMYIYKLISNDIMKSGSIIHYESK